MFENSAQDLKNSKLVFENSCLFFMLTVFVYIKLSDNRAILHIPGMHKDAILNLPSMIDILLTKLLFMLLGLVTNIAYDVINNDFALDYLLFQA